MDTKKDRRALKTEKALKSALAELLSKKDLRSITIKELTDLADIHRGTFYAHYADIYALFEQIENDVFTLIEEKSVFEPTHVYTDFFESLFAFAEDNADSFKILFSESNGSDFRQRLHNFLTATTTDLTLADENMTQDEMPERWAYLIQYGTAGLISILEKWVNSGFSYPRDEIVALCIELDNHVDKLY